MNMNPYARAKTKRVIRTMEDLRALDGTGVLDREHYDTIWRLLDGGSKRVALDASFNVVGVS